MEKGRLSPALWHFMLSASIMGNTWQGNACARVRLCDIKAVWRPVTHLAAAAVAERRLGGQFPQRLTSASMTRKSTAQHFSKIAPLLVPRPPDILTSAPPFLADGSLSELICLYFISSGLLWRSSSGVHLHLLLPPFVPGRSWLTAAKLHVCTIARSHITRSHITRSADIPCLPLLFACDMLVHLC